MKPYIYIPKVLESQAAQAKSSRHATSRVVRHGPRGVTGAEPSAGKVPATTSPMEEAGTGVGARTSLPAPARPSQPAAGSSAGVTLTSGASRGSASAEDVVPQVYRTSITIPMGDGSVLVKPGKVIHELTPAQAARHLGVHRNTIYAYIDAGVLRKVRRPSPSRILLEAEEVTALRQATQDPEYWTRERRIQLTCGKHCA